MYLVVRLNSVPARMVDEMKNRVPTMADVMAIAAIAEVQIWYKRPTPVEVPHTVWLKDGVDSSIRTFDLQDMLLSMLGEDLQAFWDTRRNLWYRMSLRMCGAGALSTTTFLSTTLIMRTLLCPRSKLQSRGSGHHSQEQGHRLCSHVS